MKRETKRLTRADLPELFERAYHAAERAESRSVDYISVRQQGNAPLGLCIIASREPGLCSACLMDYPTETAQNLLYAMVHGWSVEFTADDVDQFIDGGREL